MEDLTFHCRGDRWTVEAKNPLVRDHLAANPPAGSFTFDDVLYVAQGQIDEILDELRTVGLVDAKPAWCALIAQGVEE